MKKLVLLTFVTLLLIVPLNIFAEEDEEELSFNLKDQVIHDFKDTDYSVNDTNIEKDGNLVFTLVNDLGNTLVFKVNDNSLSNEESKELLLDVLANSIQIDGSVSFVCSNDLSYFVFSNDEEIVYRISNLNSNNEIKVSLIKNEEYINPEFDVNFDDYTIANGDTFIPSSNKDKPNKDKIEDQLISELPAGFNSTKEDEKIIIKDNKGNESFSIEKNKDNTIIKISDNNNLSEDEINEYITETVMKTYSISKDNYDIQIKDDGTIIFDKKDGAQTISVLNSNNNKEFVIAVEEKTVDDTNKEKTRDTKELIIIFESIAIVISLVLVLLLGFSYIKRNKRK